MVRQAHHERLFSTTPLLGLVLLVYLSERITSLIQIPSEDILNGDDFRSAFRIIIHHLDQIFPEFSRSSDSDTLIESMALKFDLFAKRVALEDVKAIVSSDFEKLFEGYSPAELAAFLRGVLQGRRETELRNEARKMLRQFIEEGWLRYKREMEPVRGITGQQLKRTLGPLDGEPSVEIDFGFMHFLDFLNQFNQNFYPFRLSQKGWIEKDRLQVEALSIELAFAQETLSLEKLRLIKKGQLEFIRSLFSRSDLGLDREEQKIDHLKRALTQLEAKTRAVPEGSGERQLIEDVILQLQKLRSLIHSITGFWPVTN